MALTSAERQRRFRARRAAGFALTPVPVNKPARPLPRPARWARALDELRKLQGEYETWRDGLPESLADSRTAERLDVGDRRQHVDPPTSVEQPQPPTTSTPRPR